ncbi:MAG: hypothetical protein R3E21_08380 [Caenibius sp.]
MGNPNGRYFGVRPSAITGAASPPDAISLPGPISGYGGGTFNMDGAQATLPDRQRVEGESDGSSPREAYDYEAAIERMEQNNRDANWSAKLARAAALMNDDWMGAAQITAQMADRSRKTKNTAEEWKREDWLDQRRADLRAKHPFSSGRDRVVYDPVSGKSSVVYDGPEDFEIYAQQMGLEPGTDDYFNAVEDYVLKSSGPSAHGRDLELDDHRTGNDEKLENLRQSHRVGLEGIRQKNRVDLRVAPRIGSSPAGAPPKRKRPTATGPNGEKVEWDGKAWVPVG